MHYTIFMNFFGRNLGASFSAMSHPWIEATSRKKEVANINARASVFDQPKSTPPRQLGFGKFEEPQRQVIRVATPGVSQAGLGSGVVIVNLPADIQFEYSISGRGLSTPMAGQVT